MVGVGRAVVVRHVAGTTSRGRTGIAVSMALYARCGRMRAMQREVRVVVIESRITPSRLIMAHRAIGAEARGRMIWFCGAVVFGHMAGTAGCWCASVTIRMALDARGGNVCPMQREIGDVVIEGCRPAGAGGVAARAVC